MRSLLNALQEGRLIELPEADKDKALEYLAHLIEAVPDLGGDPQLVEAVLAREKSQNTAIGLGVACPHVRVDITGELLCAVGWTPEGIDYGAADGQKVHLVVMYYIPDAQKNAYFKEISALAAAVQKARGIGAIAGAGELSAVREKLLDWVSTSIEAALPESKARMIRLEARQAQLAAAGEAPAAEAFSVFILSAPPAKPMVLCPSAEFAAVLEKDERLGDWVSRRAAFSCASFRLIFRSAAAYGLGRTLLEYWAVK
ncbi:MAG TPA: PTS sugar transporter subunit IIA [Elusimicrobiota bacterium]|nr:PTS sugar transporter subunit IIA [Elusimicrobiota bacterium]